MTTNVHAGRPGVGDTGAMTQRIVISETFGGFGLSSDGVARLRELGWDGERDFDATYLPRDDSRLVQVVEELGQRASGGHADLVVVEVPAGVKWHVHEYDGLEEIHEDHRTWSSSGDPRSGGTPCRGARQRRKAPAPPPGGWRSSGGFCVSAAALSPVTPAVGEDFGHQAGVEHGVG